MMRYDPVTDRFIMVEGGSSMLPLPEKSGRVGRDMKVTTACMIINCTAIIAFAVLAYLFGKWWIVLFAALFQCYPKTKAEEDET